MENATLSPFVIALLAKFKAYIVAHMEEIIAALLNLLPTPPTPDVERAVEGFRASPSEATFNVLVTRIEASGVEVEEAAGALLNAAHT